MSTAVTRRPAAASAIESPPIPAQRSKISPPAPRTVRIRLAFHVATRVPEACSTPARSHQSVDADTKRPRALRLAATSSNAAATIAWSCVRRRRAMADGAGIDSPGASDSSADAIRFEPSAARRSQTETLRQSRMLVQRSAAERLARTDCVCVSRRQSHIHDAGNDHRRDCANHVHSAHTNSANSCGTRRIPRRVDFATAYRIERSNLRVTEPLVGNPIASIRSIAYRHARNSSRHRGL